MSTSAATAVDLDVGPDHAIRLHRLMTAYLSSKAIFSAVQFGVFDALADGPSTAEEVAARVGVPERSARVLLLALEGEELVARADGRYRNTPTANVFLVSSSPRYMGVLARHQDNHFAKLVELDEALRSGRPVTLAEQYTGDYSAFHAATSWAPKVDIREGLSRTLDYYRTHGEQYL